MVQLEQLDETRLFALIGIYAEKRRRKHWYDQHVKSNRFQAGDLVLLYTLKKHKCKLKHRGLGPFVISELQSSGAVRLETLDGEQMPNFINGSRIKKYEEPLTEDILLRLHSARTLKEGQALLKKQAQDEARARALAIKQKRVSQMMVLETFSMNKDENEVIPPFYLNLQVVTQHGSINTAAFLDSGADLNVISHELWLALKQPVLAHSDVIFQNFSNSTTLSHGQCCLKVAIGDHSMHVVFLVA